MLKGLMIAFGYLGTVLGPRILDRLPKAFTRSALKVLALALIAQGLLVSLKGAF